jgi:hypothetical protein
MQNQVEVLKFAAESVFLLRHEARFQWNFLYKY